MRHAQRARGRARSRRWSCCGRRWARAAGTAATRPSARWPTCSLWRPWARPAAAAPPSPTACCATSTAWRSPRCGAARGAGLPAQPQPSMLCGSMAVHACHRSADGYGFSADRLPIPPPHTPRHLGPSRHPLTILRHTCYTLRYCAAPSSLGSALQGGLPGRASAPRAGHERHADADLPHHPGLAPGRRRLPGGGARAVRRPDRRDARRVCGRGLAPAPHAQAQPLHVQPARLRARRAGAPRAPGMRKQPRRQASTVVTTPGRCHTRDRSRDPGSA